MRTTIATLLTLGVLMLLQGCGGLSDYMPHAGGTSPTPGTTINEHFGQEITAYDETVLSVRMECESGICPDPAPRTETVQRPCYFCDFTHFEGDAFPLLTEGTTGSDTLANCQQRNAGPFIDGLAVKERTPERVVLAGEVLYRSQQTSLQPGACERPDYKYTLIQEVEWVFSRPTRG